MLKKAGFVVAVSVFLILAGCGGTGNVVDQVISPFAGGYSGTMTYTATSTDEPIAFTVNAAGAVSGTFTDPDLGLGSFTGTMHDDGSCAGTSLNGATFGTFTFTLVAGSGSNYTSSNGNFKPGSTTKATTISVTKA